MIMIKFNGVSMQLTSGTTIAELLKNSGTKGTSYALALNRHFIARAKYALTVLNNNDEVDVINPMQGG